MSGESLALLPFWEDFLFYKKKYLRSDLYSAFSVALLALPQSMAYAFVAGLPAESGIFAAIFGTIFTASFGASRYLISGPTTMVALLIQSAVSGIMQSNLALLYPDKSEMALIVMLHLVFLVGLIQVFAGVFKLGRLTQFASRSVVVGYTLAIAFAIVVSQIYVACGIKGVEGYQPLIFRATYVLTHLHLTHIPTLILSILCLILLTLLYRMSYKIPAPVIVFFLSGIAVAVFKLSPEYMKGIHDIQCGEKLLKVCLLQDLVPFNTVWPTLKIPYIELRFLTLLFPSAVAVAAFSALEATAIGRGFPDEKSLTYNENQEVYGLGVSNCLSAFVGAMPSSGSFSRSSLNQILGAKTRFSGVLSGIFVLFFLGALGRYVMQIPVAAISALLFFTAFSMVRPRALFLCLRSTPEDAVVVVSTFFSSLLFSLDVALYIGIGLSILLYLREAGIPMLVEYHFNDKGKLRRLDSNEKEESPICILQPEGELFFGAADPLQSKILEKSQNPKVCVIILQLLNVRHLDASVCVALQETNEVLKKQGKYLLFAGVSRRVYEILEDSGLLDSIQPGYLFFSNKQIPSEPIRKAYDKAKELIASSV
jgi:sulfate permease, SulP family